MRPETKPVSHYLAGESLGAIPSSLAICVDFIILILLISRDSGYNDETRRMQDSLTTSFVANLESLLVCSRQSTRGSGVSLKLIEIVGGV
jgi:hypothetical protein